MIERSHAIPILQPLAEPTLDAFGRAQTSVIKAREAIGEELELLAPGVAGIYHGVGFWAFFASHLERSFQGVVERDPNTSDQRHRWFTQGGGMCIHLKSDVEDLCHEQLLIDGFPAVSNAQPLLVALTWEHLGADRLHPTFIHLHNGRPIWELPVKELMASNVRSIKPSIPTPKLSLRRQKSQQTDAASD